MNPRIFKKLCKRASKIIDKSGIAKNEEKIIQTIGEETPEICFKYKWELKSYYGKKRYRGLPDYNLNTLNGTIGYGCISGYYEPEWYDRSALCLIKHIIYIHFTDWSDTDNPKDIIPKKLKTDINKIKWLEKNYCLIK